MANHIVLIAEDLMIAPRLEASVRRAGYVPLFATDEASLVRAMVNAPVLVIADLAATSFNWRKLVRLVKGPGKKNNHVPVLGFGPHVDLALRDEALAAGCTAVVGRSAVSANLPALIKKHLWHIDPAYRTEPLSPLVRQGLEAFNRGRFFECHELLEEAWNQEVRSLRILYQGILQISVGYLHITRRNWRGAVKVLERGIPKAAHFQPTCLGIDVAGLVQNAQRIVAELFDLGAERIEEFDHSRLPTIKF